MTDEDKRSVEALLQKYAVAVGFEGKEEQTMFHISTYVGILDESDYPYPKSMFLALNNIADYFERAGNHYIQNDMKAEVAIDIWKGMNA